MKLKIILLCLISILFFSCFNYRNQHEVILWTDRAELAAYIEVYNISQNAYMIETIYKEQPAEALLESKNGPFPDLIISDQINIIELSNKLESLSNILHSSSINSESFYSGLLKAGKFNNKQMLLPINFNIPIIIFKKQKEQEEDSLITISIDDIKAKCKNFNIIKGVHYKNMGFSPFWNNLFLYYTTVLFGSDFRMENKTAITWAEQSIIQTIEYFNTWYSELSYDHDKEIVFTEKYMKIPEYELIDSKTILFFMTDISNFLRIPEKKRETLDFRLLSFNNKIPVMENILFAGIPQRANNKTGSRTFLKWLFQEETQRKLMEVNHLKNLQGVFGLANGFSSLKNINETELPKPQFHPIFEGYIPDSESLIFPNILNNLWKKKIKNVIINHIKDSLTDEDYNKDLKSLIETE